VKNPDGDSKGIKFLTVNGKLIKGNLIPFNKENKDVAVIAVLGS
jgi:hypothetical protein